MSLRDSQLSTMSHQQDKASPVPEHVVWCRRSGRSAGDSGSRSAAGSKDPPTMPVWYFCSPRSTPTSSCNDSPDDSVELPPVAGCMTVIPQPPKPHRERYAAGYVAAAGADSEQFQVEYCTSSSVEDCFDDLADQTYEGGHGTPGVLPQAPELLVREPRSAHSAESRSQEVFSNVAGHIVFSSPSDTSGDASGSDSQLQEDPENPPDNEENCYAIIRDPVSGCLHKVFEVGAGDDIVEHSAEFASKCKRKPCFFLNSEMGCRYGANCKFCHSLHTGKNRPHPNKGKRVRFQKLITLQLEHGPNATSRHPGQIVPRATHHRGQDREYPSHHSAGLSSNGGMSSSMMGEPG